MNEAFWDGIYYRVNNWDESRTTLVFIHGVSGSSSAWKDFEEYFEKKYNLLSFDLRGHGLSAKSKDYRNYKTEKLIEDLYGLANHLGLKKFVLVSHSMGTLIALDFILKNQDLVQAAVFLSPNFNIRYIWLDLILIPVLWLMSAIDFLFGPPKVRGHIDYSRYVMTGDWNLRRTFADVRNTGLSIYLYFVKQYSIFEREEFLDRIKVPTLIVHGVRDSIFNVKGGKSAAEKIKNSQLVLINGADHILVLNHFPKVSAAIEKFIDETDFSHI